MSKRRKRNANIKPITYDDIAKCIPKKKRSPCLKKQEIILLSTLEAAVILGLSPRTLDNWRYLKKGPKSRKRGRKIFYDEEVILKFLENWEC